MTDLWRWTQSQERRTRATDDPSTGDGALTESRGVLAFYAVSPVGRRSSDDASKFKLSLRDVLLLFVGVVGMYGAQLTAQYGLRSDIRDLATAFSGYQQRQESTNSTLQKQIDEWRAETKLNRVNVANNERALAELKGILLGAGIKGIPK